MDEVQQMSELYFQYGIKFFELSNYLLALETWKKCFELHNKENEIIDILEKCFIFPNLAELKENYKRQCNMIQLIGIGGVPKYNELKLEVIFVQEGIWYVLDKVQKKLFGPVYISKESYKNSIKITFKDEYSDIIMKSSDFLFCIKILSNIANKKLYNVIEDLQEWYSFLKIPNIVTEFLSDIILVDSVENLFQYFHSNTHIYLPRSFFSFTEEENFYITKKLKEEHCYRISREGRNTNNIFLSICIPSYNRGTYALKNIKELLEMPYDSEVEIIVSNNGSTSDIEGYKEIQEIGEKKDSRIVYFEFSENQHLVGNFWKVMELAVGKYAIILSDEDKLILSALPYYFNLIKSNPSLGVIRSNNSIDDINSYAVIPASYEKAGKDALYEYFILGNYISGIIYKMEMITDEFIKKIVQRYKNNYSFYLYPHMFLDAILLMKYDFCKDDEILFQMGKAATRIETTDWKIDEKTGIIEYSKVEDRILQHYEWIELVNDLDINDEVKVNLYLQLCDKLFQLVKGNKIYESSWKEICIQLLEVCIKGYDKLKIEGLKNIFWNSFLKLVYLIYEKHNK